MGNREFVCSVDFSPLPVRSVDFSPLPVRSVDFSPLPGLLCVNPSARR